MINGINNNLSIGKLAGGQLTQLPELAKAAFAGPPIEPVDFRQQTRLLAEMSCELVRTRSSHRRVPKPL